MISYFAHISLESLCYSFKSYEKQKLEFMYIRDCARRERGHLGGVERIEVARENRRRRKISAAAAGLTNKAKKWSMARGQVYVCVCVLTCLFFPIFLFLSNTHTHVGRVSFFLTDCLVCLLTSSAMHSPPAQKQTFAKDIPSHLSVVLDSFFF